LSINNCSRWITRQRTYCVFGRYKSTQISETLGDFVLASANNRSGYFAVLFYTVCKYGFLWL